MTLSMNTQAYKNILIFLLFLLSLNLFAQTDYINGNEAYWTEKDSGFNPVTIGGGSVVYTYNVTNKQYINGSNILIPDLVETPDGVTVNENTFYGFGIGGNPSDTAYQWDAQKVILQPNIFDVSDMFISPVSSSQMTYGRAIQYNNSSCIYGSCCITIDGPVSTLAYPDNSPIYGTYEAWTGEELINAGDIKGTGLDQKISQQQLDTTENMSYCVATYGRGWRLPTDIEAGHLNDIQGTGNGWHNGYKGTLIYYMWTSSLFISYTVKRWPLCLSDGWWENCAGFLYVNNYVRCVFPGKSIVTNTTENKNQNANLLIHPNPANEQINILFISDLYSIVDVSILNINGTIINRERLTNIYPGFTKTIDLKQFAKGIYYIKIIYDKGVLIRKLVKI